jgi:membrane associated rhomboid family serine protease
MPKLNFRYYPQLISPDQVEIEKKIFRYSLVVPLLFLIVIWMIKIAEIILDLPLTRWGIFPRHAKGLTGILTAPLIHGDFGHLIGNSSSFLVLATALFFFYRKLAYPIFILNYLMAGLFLWLGGREVWHIGASGVIYGMAAFLMFSGVFRKDVRLLTISLIVIFLYGSLIWGLFPLVEGISWDGHLMGAASGIILSFIFHRKGPPRQRFEWEDESDDDSESNENSSLSEDENTEKKDNNLETNINYN